MGHGDGTGNEGTGIREQGTGSEGLFAGLGLLRGLGLGGQGNDDFAGLGVVELLVRFADDGAGVGLEVLDAVAHPGVLLLDVLDLLLEGAVLGALPEPAAEAVLAVDDMPCDEQGEEDGDERAGGTPEALRPCPRPFAQRGGPGGRRPGPGLCVLWHAVLEYSCERYPSGAKAPILLLHRPRHD